MKAAKHYVQVFYDSIYMSGIGKSRGLEKRSVARGWGGGEESGDQRLINEGHRISFGDDGNVLKLTVVMLAQLCEYAKNHQIVYFK